MANEEVLGPRKTMFVLVIVVGCFAVLWPRILSPLILGHTRDQLKPNQYDRDAGCCEVIFETEVAVLELLTEVCSSAMGVDGKLSPMAAAECRKSVNESCGLDIAAFFKRNDNVGKTTKMLVETMKNSNSSCLKERFGVPVWSLSSHQALNSWTQQDTLKQERPIMRGAGPHPALRERGRAIPAGAPTPPSRGPVPLPAHARVRSSPLSVYFELDIKPPPIPGMRPPLGSPGGPVAAPKSSMGFVMPIYTICIIVFFVYTLSKILFKRTGSVPYEPIQPDPQFRRRVFRDDSRSSPDTKLVVTAISGLVAEVQQQMEASYAPNQQRQDVQDNLTRPYTNGTVLGNSTTPVQIIASEYREPSKEKSPEPQKEKEQSPEPVPKPKVPIPEPEPQESKPAPEPVQEDESNESNEAREPTPEGKEQAKTQPAVTPESVETKTEPDIDLFKLTEDIVKKDADLLVTSTNDFLDNAREEFKILSTPDLEERTKEKQSTQELLEEALKEDSPTKERDVTEDQENASVKVVGMELTAHTADGGAWPRAEPPPVTPLPPQRPPHEAEEVKSIYLETEIPQQSRVLVTDFVEDTADRPTPTKHSPLNKENYLQQLVVSGKMTLSLIQDAPRETPERDLESTMDEFTTASAVTQPAAEKEGNLSEDEVDEEIEVEEIEVEEIEDEEEPLKIEDVMIAEKIEELKAAAEEIDEIKEAAEKNETDELVVVQKIKVKESADETNEVIESPEEIEELKEKVETLEYVERAAETIEVQEAAERIEEVKEAVEETEVEETLEKTDEVKETAEEPEVKEIFEKIEKIKEAAENTREVKDVIEKTDEVKETIEEIDGMMEAAEETEELKEAAEKTDEVKETVEELEVVKETTGETEELKEAVKEIEQLKEPVEETEEVKEIVEEIEEVKETTGETEELKEAVKEIEEVKEPVEKTDELKEIEVKETAGKIEELKETVKKTEEVAEVADKSDEAKETVEEKKEVKEAAENIEEVKEAAATTEEVKEAPKKSGKRRKRGKRTEESDKSQELEK